MQKNKTIRQRVLGILLPVMTFGFAALTMVPTIEVTAENTRADLPVYKLSVDDENPMVTLTEEVIKDRASRDEKIDLNTTDLRRSTVEVTNLNLTKTGLQTVEVKAYAASTDGTSSVGYTFSEDAVINVLTSTKPQLRLKSEAVQVNNGDVFNPESYIAYADADSNGQLPAIRIESNVNMNQDGNYSVVYTAVNMKGETTTKSLNVSVRTTDEMVEQKRIERGRILAKKARDVEGADYKTLEESMPSGFITMNGPAVLGGTNPYPVGIPWDNCTWSVWQLVYNYDQISLPGWGDAGMWLDGAAADGYEIGAEPVPGSIMVLSNHVTFVVETKGEYLHIQEGNYLGHYMDRWVPKSSSIDGQYIKGYIYL
jgi:hypothetical protein